MRPLAQRDMMMMMKNLIIHCIFLAHLGDISSLLGLATDILARGTCLQAKIHGVQYMAPPILPDMPPKTKKIVF